MTSMPENAPTSESAAPMAPALRLWKIWLALGVAIEWAQGASGWRHADAADAAANAVGVAMGWALVSAQRRWWAL